MSKNILSVLVWLPILSGTLGLVFNNKHVRYLIVLLNMVNFLISLLLMKKFDVSGATWQFSENYKLIPEVGITYSLGVDSLAVLLVVLSCFIVLLALTFNRSKNNEISNDINYKPTALLSISSGLINGVLVSTNVIVFYMFFESILIPLYLIIGFLGGSNRVHAATKFCLYTFFGSLLFFIGIIFLYNIASKIGIEVTKIFDLTNFYSIKLTDVQQMVLFIALFIAFAIKIPIIPLHTWLPEAHYEAPTPASVVLSAICLKLGVFAIIRFLAPLTMHANCYFSKYIIVLSSIGILYIGFIAFAQKNLKKLIAYSSIAHMGLIMIGLFLIFNFIKNNALDAANVGLNGALTQIFTHSLTVSGLFFSAGILLDRFDSNKINDFVGLANFMPRFSILFTLFCLSNIAMPGTFNFIGKLFILLASFQYSILLTGLIVTDFILSLFYTFSMYQSIMFGSFKVNKHDFIDKNNVDLRLKETLILGILGMLIIFLGFKPGLIIDLLNNFSFNFIKTLSSNL